ncbi:MAG: DNA mismatch repair endonuclease MutL [Clostridia bacterium]|nr:DNA mismatch repair endonuclease MutL [Clostridia bacterium]
MAKINILPAKVYNHIAAGEVIERSYSVVKELVENSIDAGATEIEIHVERGGKQLIKVIDNGCGIGRDDLQSAFLPHATSKIAAVEDMASVRTLGFRGEAIASIAAVSKMTITSKVDGEKCYSLTSEGGVLGNIREVSGQKGTEVCVEMLFYNTPVRLGYLKSDKAEESDIITFVSRFVLSRPKIAFTCFVNGKIAVQSFGEGEDEAFVSVYGTSALQNCYKIDAEKHGIRVRGYIGNQSFLKPNKSYQCVFLNGRYILNNTIVNALMGAYSPYLMKRQYPFYVLYITMPTDIVDVNVHPNKADVRFVNNNLIYGCICTIVKNVLDGNAQALAYLVRDEDSAAVAEPVAQSVKEETEQAASLAAEPSKANKTLSEEILELSSMRVQEVPTQNDGAVYGFNTMSMAEATEEIGLCKPDLQDLPSNSKKDEEREKAHAKGIIPLDEIPDYKYRYLTKEEWEELNDPAARRKDPEKLKRRFPNAPYERMVFVWDDPRHMDAKSKNEDVFSANKRYLEELDEKNRRNRLDIEQCDYVGCLFHTYLLYEFGDDGYIIDQHAAHERILFDRLKEQMQRRKPLTQGMLTPYELKLNNFEATFIRERLADICSMGFEIEEKGETQFDVWCVPADVQKMDIGVFFNEILGDVNGYRAIKLEEILRDKLAMAACKAAVKGGQRLSDEEVKELLRQMNGDMSLKCPHGRPVAQKVKRKQLEKMFKRIV